MKRKIIIDTDPGHDDAMALMLAINSSMFDIQAITTICGNSGIENTTRNARYILGLLQREDIPVFSGESKPMKKKLKKAVVHGASGLAGINPKNKAFLTKNAVDKIVELVKNNPNEITLVTLGPLTNIAKAIKKNPRVMMQAKEIVSMGGAINVGGNMNAVAEFNMFVDPDAAKIVIDFPVNKTLVPLDVCNVIEMTMEDFKKISNETIRKPLLQMINPFMENLEKYETGKRSALMYDPLTIYFLLSPQSCTTRKYNIQIETKGELTRGMTVADLRAIPKELVNVTVVTSIDSTRFKRDFIKILNKSLPHHNQSL